MTDIQEPKVNGEGRKCPGWCATDHTIPNRELDNCRTNEPSMLARNGTTAWAFASLSPYTDTPYVAASAAEGMVFARTPEEARELAGMVRGLADFTPAKIRQFAAQIDRSASAAFGAEPEAGQ